MSTFHNQSELCRLEVASASSPQDARHRLLLVDAYRKAAMTEIANKETSRLSRQFPDDPKVLSVVLAMLVEKKAITVLKGMIERMIRIKDPPLELRLSLARVLTILGRYEQAAANYASVITDFHIYENAVESLSEFVQCHPEIPVLSDRLSLLVAKDHFQNSHVLSKYTIFRVLVEKDPSKAVDILDQINFNKINSVKIVFDLAIQAFRLARWNYALNAAQRVLLLDPNNTSVQSFMISANTFAGKYDDVYQLYKRIISAHSPMRLTEHQIDAIDQVVTKQTGKIPTTAMIVSNSHGAKGCQIHYLGLEQNNDDILSATCQDSNAIAVSVVDTNSIMPRVWETLVEVNFQGPHVIVQNNRSKPVLHAFIAAEEYESWPWHEVPIVLEVGQSNDLAYRYTFMSTHPYGASNNGRERNIFGEKVQMELNRIRSIRS